MEDTKHRLTFTRREIDILAHLTRHFSDYMSGDDRPDHGMSILKGYRDEHMKYGLFEEKPEWLQAFISAMGKFNRFSRKLRK